MYPSLDINTVARVAHEEYLNCDLDMNVNPEELALYLAVVKEPEELAQLGLTNVVPTRMHRRGAKSGVRGNP